MPTSAKARIALWVVIAVGLSVLFEAGEGLRLGQIAVWSLVFFGAALLGEPLARIERVWVQLAIVAAGVMVLSILASLVLGGSVGDVFGAASAAAVFGVVMVGVYALLQQVRPRTPRSPGSR